MNNNKQHILIIDDEYRFADSMKKLLLTEGYQVSAVQNGKEALDEVEKQNIDLILLDLVLPDQDGYQIMKLLEETSTDAIIVVVTGHGSIDSAVRCLRGGAFDYIKKPFEPEILLRRVANALDQRRLEKAKDRVESMLEESQESYEYLIQNSPDLIYTLDREGKFSFIAGPVKELLGYEREELLGKHYSEIVHSDDLEKAQFTFNERRLVSRKSRFVELRFNINPETVGSMGGLSQRTVELRSKGVYELEGESNSQIGSYGVARDITERKKSEELIGNNLKEKEVLLKEIHHRVKNNMQIISSLIKLQERRVEEEEVRRALQTSQNRIMAMSLIHEVLYQSGDLAAIDMSLYIKRLTSNLFGVFGVNSQTIKLGIEVEQLSLGMNQALPCGLILNELLSNALQYAFTEREGGKIIVEASPLKEGVVAIHVADNGKGLPSDAEGQSDKLGLKLVRGLVEDQLKGELKISRVAGTVYTIRFKKR